MTDELADVVFTSDGMMGSVHPRQLRTLVSLGLVAHIAGRWRTELTADELAERVASTMGICDFCSVPQPVWEFPCADFETPSVPSLQVGQLSIGSWGACERCAHLIRTGRWEQLGTRAAASIVAEHPEMQASTGQLREYLLDLHREFAKHRCGPPVRVGSSPGHGTF